MGEISATLEKEIATHFSIATAATAAKSLQSCPTLCDPIDGSPPGSSVPRILQARILEWVAISFFSILVWKIPWMEEPGKLQSIESQRVGHACATSLSRSLSDMQVTPL